MLNLYSAFPNIDQSALHLIPLSLEYVICLTMTSAYTYFGLYYEQLPNMAQFNKAIETKYLAKDTNTLVTKGLELTV